MVNSTGSGSEDRRFESNQGLRYEVLGVNMYIAMLFLLNTLTLLTVFTLYALYLRNRSVFNFAPRSPKGRKGAKFDPRVEVDP
jgi:hypothetical protein